jgi:hypothetical protein
VPHCGDSLSLSLSWRRIITITTEVDHGPEHVRRLGIQLTINLPIENIIRKKLWATYRLFYNYL